MVQGSYAPAAPWARLRAWIDEKEAWEQQNQMPAQLTVKQLAAISNIITLAPEPAIDDYNYVSELMEYYQAIQAKPPTFTDEGPIDVMVDGIKQPLWRCTCVLSIHGSPSFPSEGYGLDPGVPQPAFKSKKVAKQFAAQQALRYLQDQQRGNARSSPVQPTSPPSKRPKVEEGDGGVLVFPEQIPDTLSNTTYPSNPHSSSRGLSSIPSKTSSSILDKVAELANTLGIGSVGYRAEPDENNPGMWNAWPHFALGARVPEDLGRVAGIMGQNEAKLAVAEKLHIWMTVALKEREAEFQHLREMYGGRANS